MEIRHLRYFRVLAEQLHFSRAALLLNVAQPALSHQIKQLEDELGTQLVERTNRRVRLTPAGEVLLARATRILEQIDQAARETAQVGQGDAGSLVIGVVSTAVCSILPELLRSFRRESPRLAIDIREMEPGEQIEALRKEAIDVGMFFLSIQDPALDSVVVSRERLILGQGTASRPPRDNSGAHRFTAPGTAIQAPNRAASQSKIYASFQPTVNTCRLVKTVDT